MSDSNGRIAVARRLRGAREAAGRTVEETAAAVGMVVADYAACEAGECDVSMGILPALAKLFEMEVSAILTGGDPHATVFSVTRKGTGAVIQRRKAYHYENLAAGFTRPRMEPFIVTVDPKSGAPFNLNSHAGQEFDLVVEGRLELQIGTSTLVLEPGDSIYYDASHPHGMRAMDGKPVKFLAVITD